MLNMLRVNYKETMLVIALSESFSHTHTPTCLDVLKILSRSYKVSMENMLTYSKDELHGSTAAFS